MFKPLITAAVMAYAAPTMAAEVRYSPGYEITAECQLLGAEAANTPDADRILCDCEQGKEICAVWDNSGYIVGILRATDQQPATRPGSLSNTSEEANP